MDWFSVLASASRGLFGAIVVRCLCSIDIDNRRPLVATKKSSGAPSVGRDPRANLAVDGGTVAADFDSAAI